MPTILHKDIRPVLGTPNAGAHVLHYYTFNNTLDMTAGTDALLGGVVFTPTDIGKVARVGVVAPFQFYILLNDVGPVWKLFSDVIAFLAATTTNVSINSRKITSMAAGTASTDGANFGQVTSVSFPNASTAAASPITLDDSYNGKTIYNEVAGELQIHVPQTLTVGFSCSVQNVDPLATTTWIADGTVVFFSVSNFTKNTTTNAVSGVIFRSATHAALVGLLDS